METLEQHPLVLVNIKELFIVGEERSAVGI
jgi:hypothetical protein